jgi:hypothetical protein
VAAPLCLAAEASDRDNFFHAIYPRAPRNCREAPVPTSEIALAGVASGLERSIGNPVRFDIRWLGAIHALLFLGGYALLLGLLRPLSAMARAALSLLALWIFADIGTLAYFNSFYTDVAALLGTLAATMLAVRLLDSPGVRLLVLFGLAALLAITSKAQHGLFGLMPAGFAVLMAHRATDRRARVAGVTVAVSLFAATVWIVAATPAWYSAEARFNLIFYRILPHSSSPGRDLAELGLDAGDARYIGMHSFLSGGPMENPAWVAAFEHRCTFGGVLRFYLRRPSIPWTILRDDLEKDGWARRVPGLANFTRESGRPEGTIATSLGSWSALRTSMARAWPPQIFFWLVLLPAVAIWYAARHPVPVVRALAGTLTSVALLAWGEFLLACLTDTLETPRHLTLFHLFTDLAIFLGAVLAAYSIEAACAVSLRRSAGIVTAAALVVFAGAIVKSEVFPPVTIVPATWDPGAAAVDDASSAISYAGKWSSGTFASAFRGTLTFSDDPGAAARFSFDGVELQYAFTRAPNRGIAEVFIDGAARGTVDLYAPQVVWQAHTVFAGLATGRHTAEIRVLGRHNSLSSGDFVDVDGFAVR